ncbi:MAG: 50S ribosomal protein L23 [Candidatus Omnitrophica bacterium]|nr:50S ribosomal protein L23 [Candidatus Omnitrophota bacterium]
MKITHDIIKNMVRTEKGSILLTQNKYIFKVDKAANKIEIKNAVENVYNVQVSKVHIMNVKGKKKRVRLHEGMTTGWKKAVVTLKPESRIEVV